MNVVLEKMDGQVYAMSPIIERIGGQNQMRLAYSGCTHILLLCAKLDQKIGFMDEATRELVKNLNSDILSGKKISLCEQPQVTAWTVDFMTFQRNLGKIQLPEMAANYAVCACCHDQQTDVLSLYLPERVSVQYQATVSVEIPYKVEPYRISVKTGFLGMREELQDTDFYKATVGTENSNFHSGDIVYKVSAEKYLYPVPERMKGREFLIRSKKGAPPEFSSAVSGITLRRM